MNCILKFSALSGGYYNRPDVVRNVSLDINTGDFVGILGPNGCGKTTLLRLATRVLAPAFGAVLFKDKDIRDIGLKELGRNTAFVAGNISEFPLVVRDFVLMGRIPHLRRMQTESKKDFEIVDNALVMAYASHLAEKKTDELSAGERQRVLLARALAQQPALLFLDEPTSHLDIGCQIQIMDLLKKLNRDNRLTVVMILHDLNLAGAYCDKIVLMDKGTVYREGTPCEVLTYQNIESVYRTIVLVNENPVTHSPNVVLVPGAATMSTRVSHCGT